MFFDAMILIQVNYTKKQLKQTDLKFFGPKGADPTLEAK
jgi:hypothetical protein